MKVNLGPYLTWWGPYQIAEVLLFWKPKDCDVVFKLGTKLAERKDGSKTWLNQLCEKIHEKRKRKLKVRIDEYDVWSMDSTLAIIILPMLRKLKQSKHGSPQVDLEDVPEKLRSTNTETYSSQLTFEFYHQDHHRGSLHDRWDWVINEMIWCFEQLQPDVDWEAQYWKTKPEFQGNRWLPGECDWAKLQQHQQRINRALKLFGKYYQALWD